MQPDYSILLKNKEFYPSWEKHYDVSLSYPENILNLIKKVAILPYDFYKIIAAYYLIPSALVKRIPYLFFYGLSGSGKSTMAKLAGYIHGVTPITSSTTYAAIRNDLRSNKAKYIMIPNPKPDLPDMPKLVESNYFMVLEDVDANTFKREPNLYALLKCGYDKQTDLIKMSSKENGTNESFRCFAPKVFSSIHPIHAIEDYKELRRRLIVIPFKQVNDAEILDIDNLDWSEFSVKFNEFWSYEQAEIFLIIRSNLNRIKGLNCQEKAICLDLIAVGVSTGIWSDEIEAVQELKDCFSWLKKDVQSESPPLEKLLTELTTEIEKNGQQCIYSNQLKVIIDAWVTKGFLLEKPKNKEVIDIMRKLNYKINSRGQWAKKL